MHSSLAVSMILLAFSLAPAAGFAQTILVDAVHAHHYAEARLRPGEFDYHALNGLGDALDDQRASGATIKVFDQGRLDAAAFDGVDVYLLNLVSDNLPNFLVPEINAIVEFVHRGGGMVVVTDHSNCYHHANRLEPLFDALGLSVFRESALDVVPRALGEGPGWILVDDLRGELVDGLRAISMQTGGTVHPEGAVAFLSGNGWGDRWSTAPYGENGAAANYGNFELDGGERRGALPVVSAVERGKGRIVLLGDQNMIGNTWIRVADNRELMRRAILWSMHAGFAKNRALSEREQERVTLLEDYAHSRFADDSRAGFYRALVELGRHLPTHLSHGVRAVVPLVVVAPREQALDEARLEELERHLRAGRPVLWLQTDDDRIGARDAGLGALVASLQMLETVVDGRSSWTARGIGRIELEENAGRFANRYLAAPTEEPRRAETQRAELWVRTVRQLLNDPR